MTSLIEQVAQDEEELKKLLDGGDAASAEDVKPETVEEPAKEAPADVEEQPAQEEPAQEVEPEKEAAQETVEAKPDAAAFIKARREKRAAEQRAAEEAAKRAEIEARLAAVEKAKEEAAKAAEPVRQEVDAEPNRTTDYEAWLEWNIRQTRKLAEETRREADELREWKAKQEREVREREVFMQAEAGLAHLEKRYLDENPEYAEAKEHGIKEMKRAMKVLNPRMDDAVIDMQVKRYILEQADALLKAGQNPCDAIFEYAIETLGYVPRELRQQEEQAEPVVVKPKLSVVQTPKPKIDLAKIDANKRRSASSAANSGSGGKNELTLEDFANMDNSEFLRNLSQIEESQLRARG